MNNLGLIRTDPDSNTNFMFMKGGKGESKIDFSCHSAELKTTVRTLDHEEFPLNISTHIPLIYEVEYEKIEPKVNQVEESSEANKDKMFFKRKRLTDESSDLELYEYKTGIYTLVALHFLSDLPICKQMSCLGQMLAFAGDTGCSEMKDIQNLAQT